MAYATQPIDTSRDMALMINQDLWRICNWKCGWGWKGAILAHPLTDSLKTRVEAKLVKYRTAKAANSHSRESHSSFTRFDKLLRRRIAGCGGVSLSLASLAGKRESFHFYTSD